MDPTLKLDYTTALHGVGIAARQSRDDRDSLIVQAHRDGMSLRAIADAVGMSHMGVKRIVEREGE